MRVGPEESLSIEAENECRLFSCFDNCGNVSNIEGGVQVPGFREQVSSSSIENSKYELMKDAEDFLASEMSKLSLQELSKAMDDVHCVGEELQETPEMIQNSLADFDRLIQMESKQTFIYRYATNQNRKYVEDPAFRIKFLRANLFDVPKAVDQMLAFLHLKALRFGKEAVARDITLDDMEEKEIELMVSGAYFHLQGQRDRAGRPVLYMFFHGGVPPCTAETAVRQWAYRNTLTP